MPAFPLFVDLEGKNVLIVGGGHIAAHKIRVLEPFGPGLFAVAPEFLPELESLPDLTRIRRPFEPGDLDDMDLVIAATDDQGLNELVALEARRRRIPVNVVDDPVLSGFYFGSLITDGDLTVGISTSGASPAAARLLKERLRQALPEDTGAALAVLKTLRHLVKELIPDPKRRSQVLERLAREALSDV